MSNAYNQGFMDETSRHCTAFTSPWGLYEWLCIPFVLSNATLAFQRFVNECLVCLKDLACIPYLDDVLCHGKTFDEHIGNLRMILRRLNPHGVELRAKKCFFFKNEVKYLGKIISEEGYRDNPIDAEAFQKLKQKPSNVEDLPKLLGFAGYHRY